MDFPHKSICFFGKINLGIYLYKNFFITKIQMHKNQVASRLNTANKYYQNQLKKQKDIQEYYRNTLEQLQIRRRNLQGLLSGTSKQKANVESGYFEAQSQRSLMSQSKISVSIENPSKIQKSSQKKIVGPVDFEMQYKGHAKNIVKYMENIIQKQQESSSKKNITNNSKRNTSFIQKPMQTSRIVNKQKKENVSSPHRRTKTEADMSQLTKKQLILFDLGNTTALACEDQIVNNLLRNLKSQEERYVDNVLAQTQLITKQKTTNYMLHQAEKNEEILFKMRQELIDRSLSKLQSNKETIKSGYTQKMKNMVEAGLKNRSLAG